MIALYILWRYPSLRLHRAFALQALGMGIYAVFLVGLAEARDGAFASNWVRYGDLMMDAPVFTFFYFSIVFSRAEVLRWPKWLLGAACVPAGVDVVGRLFSWWPLPPMEFRPSQGWFPGLEWPYYHLYLPVLFVLVACSFGLLQWRFWVTTKKLERQSLGIFVAAMGLAFCLAMTCFFRHASFLMPLGPLCYAGVMAYGITRQGFLDLRLVVREAAVAALGALLLTAGVALLILAGLKLLDLPLDLGSLLAAALLFALFYPLSQRVARGLLGRWLGREYSVSRRLLDYSLMAVERPAFEDLVRATLERLRQEHGLASACLYLPQRGSGLGVYASSPAGFKSPALEPSGELGLLLLGSPQGLDRDTLGWTRLYERRPPREDGVELARAFLEGSGLQACFPLALRDRLGGVLAVGAPSSGRPLSRHEVEFLAALARQLAGMAENNALEAQVQHVDRLSTLGLLSAGLAHDIRNPLAALSVYAQMLPSRSTDADFLKKFERVLGEELRKLTRLCDDMSDLARPATRAQGAVDLGILCERERALLTHPFRKRQVELRLRCPEGLLVKGDETRLSQVLLNLLLNALEASPAGAEVRMDVLRLASGAEVRVADQGRGIRQEDLPRLFEPFFTTKEHGHGLGLATCRRIVESLGGGIEAANAPGGGAEFIVRLPWAEADLEAVGGAA